MSYRILLHYSSESQHKARGNIYTKLRKAEVRRGKLLSEGFWYLLHLQWARRRRQYHGERERNVQALYLWKREGTRRHVCIPVGGNILIAKILLFPSLYNDISLPHHIPHFSLIYMCCDFLSQMFYSNFWRMEFMMRACVRKKST